MNREPIPPEKIGCHRTGFQKTCRELVIAGTCNRYRSRLGRDTKSGELVMVYDCLDNWLMPLADLQAQRTNELGASIESFRNEVAAINGFPDGHPVAPLIGAARAKELPGPTA